MSQSVNGTILSSSTVSGGGLQSNTQIDHQTDLGFDDLDLTADLSKAGLSGNLSPRADGTRDYVDILQAEYLRRKTKNPLYSVRAFAMHLRIHVSALSRILNRKQALSLKAATVIVKNLDLAPDEQERLLLSIAAQRVDEIVDRLSKPLDSRLKISFEHF